MEENKLANYYDNLKKAGPAYTKTGRSGGLGFSKKDGKTAPAAAPAVGGYGRYAFVSFQKAAAKPETNEAEEQTDWTAAKEPVAGGQAVIPQGKHQYFDDEEEAPEGKAQAEPSAPAEGSRKKKSADQSPAVAEPGAHERKRKKKQRHVEADVPLQDAEIREDTDVGAKKKKKKKSTPGGETPAQALDEEHASEEMGAAETPGGEERRTKKRKKSLAVEPVVVLSEDTEARHKKKKKRKESQGDAEEAPAEPAQEAGEVLKDDEEVHGKKEKKKRKTGTSD